MQGDDDLISEPAIAELRINVIESQHHSQPIFTVTSFIHVFCC